METGATRSHDDADAAGDAPAANLSSIAARGYAWLVLQAAAGKVLSALAQVALAWLLAPEDFGLAALAYTVLAFSALFHPNGIQEILVQRHVGLRRWEDAASSMAVAGGLLGSVLMLALGPVAAAAYGNSRLVGIVAVLALVPPVNALSVVPQARLQAGLRFGSMAAITLVCAVLQPVLTVGLAALGLAAYSFVLPVPVVALVRFAVTQRAAGRWRPRSLRLRRWRFLARDALHTWAAGIVQGLVLTADYALLGLFRLEATVGLYYAAFGFSAQVLILVAQTGMAVLFPALTRLRDQPERQAAAYLRASSRMAFLVFPACALQALVAPTLVRLLLEPKWESIVPGLQVLSVGMGLYSVSGAAHSLLRATGRFARVTKQLLRHLALLLLLALPSALLPLVSGFPLHFAAAVSAAYAMAGLLDFAHVARRLGIPPSDALGAVLWPAGLTLVAAAAGIGIESLLRCGEASDWLCALAAAGCFVLCYGVALRALRRATFDDLWARARGLLRGR